MCFNNKNFKTFLTTFSLVIFVSVCECKEISSNAKVTPLSNFVPITSSLSTTSTLHAANAIHVTAPKDGLNKRNTKINDFASNQPTNRAVGKSFDPSPEYYSGPSSTTSSSSASKSADFSNHNNAASGYISKPVTFPDTTERAKYTDASGGYSEKDYRKWQSPRTPNQVYGDLQDRISVGHYGSSDHSTAHGGASSSFLHGTGISAGYGGYNGGYGYDAARPYPHDYHEGGAGAGVGGPRYPVVTHGGSGSGGHGGYYLGSHGDETAGIPFDVYGSKGHYNGAGGEYSYTTYPDAHENVAHKGGIYGGDWQHKALLAKSFLIPVLSAAALGIAAAFATNPLLLQLGTVSGPALVGKRRKRRDLMENSKSGRLAYRAHRRA